MGDVGDVGDVRGCVVCGVCGVDASGIGVKGFFLLRGFVRMKRNHAHGYSKFFDGGKNRG